MHSLQMYFLGLQNGVFNNGCFFEFSTHRSDMHFVSYMLQFNRHHLFKKSVLTKNVLTFKEMTLTLDLGLSHGPDSELSPGILSCPAFV